MNSTRWQISKMPRRTIVRLLSFGIALVVGLAGAAMYNRNLANQYQMQLEYSYQRALEDLSSNMNTIDLTLEKGIYAGTPSQLSTIAARLWRESGSAKSALAQLPTANDDIAVINKFLSQVGDYSLALSKKSIEGNKITDTEREGLISLSNSAATLARQLSDVRSLYEEGKLWRGEVEDVFKESDITKGTDDSFGNNLTEIEETMTDYPTLIYDGPFSDHLLNAEPEMSKGAKQVSREEARSVAAKAIDVPTSQVMDDGDEDGSMPAFGFVYNNTNITVTKNGGYVVYMRNSREVGEQTLSYDAILPKATDYLKKRFPNSSFKESYYLTDEGICVINFAYKNGATVCYTDLIKVGVALDNGEILFFEARGYLMNHKERTIATPKYTAEEAQKVLSQSLKVQSVQQSLIPSGGKNELHCYEFHCKGLNNEDILVYVNTSTLAEEQILILLETEGGMLAK